MAAGFRRGGRMWWTIGAWFLLVARASASTLTVTNLADSGPGSLRQAIADAAPYDAIVVDVAGTITLTSGALVVDKDNITISGPGSGALTIDAVHASRVFEIGTTWTPFHVGISGMTLKNGSAAMGGGILNYATLGLMDVVMTGHIASNEGGAILNWHTLLLLDTVITGNRAWIGGGISNHDGVLSVYRSTISYNTADGPYGGMGGGISSSRGGYVGLPEIETLTILDSVISNNTASLRGGGIYNAAGLATIYNSTIASNTCTYIGPTGPCLCPGGGGIYNSIGTVRIERSTVAGNSAMTAGGAITTLYGVVTMKASILARGLSAPNCYVGPYGGTITSEGFNLSDDGSCAAVFTTYSDRNDTPAGLSPMGLENNGGPTATIQLLPWSAAIDAVSDCVGADERGVLRPQGNACDSGAFERVASPYAADVQMPIKADGTTVFSANRGVVPVKFTLSIAGAPVCELPRATIAVARLAGDAVGPISDSAYELPADRGRDFRIDTSSCQYVYNLAIGEFTPGKYWVSISMDGEVIGDVTFGIR